MSSTSRATRSNGQLVVKLDPTTGVRLEIDAHRADKGGPQAITLDMEFEEEGGEGPTPYEVLLQAAMDGDSTPFTRQDGVEETWRIMAPLLEHPPPVHPYEKGSWGPAEAERSARRRRALARTVGVVSSGLAEGPKRSRKRPRTDDQAPRPSPPPRVPPRAQPRRRPSRRSPTTRSCRIATPARCSPRMGQSTGSACRALMRRACSAPCLTARRALFRPRSIVRHHGPARPATTCPGTNVMVTTWKTPSGWTRGLRCADHGANRARG